MFIKSAQLVALTFLKPGEYGRKICNPLTEIILDSSEMKLPRNIIGGLGNVYSLEKKGLKEDNFLTINNTTSHRRKRCF